MFQLLLLLSPDADKGMWKRRSWYEEEAKNMMQKTQEDLRQIEELYSSKPEGKKGYFSQPMSLAYNNFLSIKYEHTSKQIRNRFSKLYF